MFYCGFFKIPHECEGHVTFTETLNFNFWRTSTCIQNFINIHQWKLWKISTFACETLGSIYSINFLFFKMHVLNDKICNNSVKNCAIYLFFIKVTGRMFSSTFCAKLDFEFLYVKFVLLRRDTYMMKFY